LFQILPLAFQTIIVAPVLLLPVADKFGYGNMYKHILVGIVLFMVSCMILVALAPTGKTNSGVVEKIVR
jgi:hypothetical protein